MSVVDDSNGHLLTGQDQAHIYHPVQAVQAHNRFHHDARLSDFDRAY